MNQLLGDLAWVHAQLPEFSEKLQQFTFCNSMLIMVDGFWWAMSEEEAMAGPPNCCGLTVSQDFAPVNSTAEASQVEQWLRRNNENTRTQL